MKQLGETLIVVTSTFDTYLKIDEFIYWAVGGPDTASLDLNLLDRIADNALNNYEWILRKEIDFLVVDNFGK